MPYKIVKRAEQYCVVKKTTGESKGCSRTAAEAGKHMAALYANEPKAAKNPTEAQQESLHISMRHMAMSDSSGYTVRKETFEGRPHLVVPVVMLVEGVVHAINAANAELVTAKEFGKQPKTWNGRPIFHGHPMRNGKPVSGNLPEILAKEKIGTVFNATADDKLAGEAWIDETACRDRAPSLLKRIEALESIEISVGAFVDTDDEEADWNGTPYKGKWRDIISDHLALLPAGDEGACSINMGCGIRAAIGNGSNQYGSKGTANAHKEAAAAHRAAGNAHVAAGSHNTGTVAGKNNEISAHTTAHEKSLAAQNATNKANAGSQKANVNTSHGSHATQAAGRASAASRGGNHSEATSAHREAADHHEAIANLIHGAEATREQMTADSNGKTKRVAMSAENASAFARLMQQARDFFRIQQSPDEMTSSDLSKRLLEAIQEDEPNVLGIEAFYPVSDPNTVVYRVWEKTDMGAMSMGPNTCLYQCTFSLSADGVVTLNDDEKEVAVVTTYEPVEESEDEVKAAAAAKIASAAAGAPASEPTKKPCGCGPKAAEKKPMKTREERITALMACEHSPVKDKAILESLTDAQLKVMSKNGKILTALGQGSEFKVCATKADAEEVIKKMADAHTALHGYAGTMAAKAAKDSTPPAGEDGTAGKGSTQKVDQAKGSKDPKAAQAATFAELLEAADPDTRTAINAATAAAKARKAESIKSLKANPKSKFTDEQLEAMPVDQLENLVALTGGEIRDYSGAGTTRKDAPEGIPAPTDLGEAIRAARAKK